MSNTNELKPCPFCGSKKLSMRKVCAGKLYYRIDCIDTKTSWGNAHVEGPLAETEAGAIVAWNKRVEDKK